MSTVQLAFDTRLERYVAVKLLAEHLAEDPTFVSRFQREAMAAARLIHPNIVQVFDSGLDRRSGRHYIVMEFIEGQSCAEILRERGWLGVEDTMAIILGSCEGLAYAHRKGVVHRDVKPGNLLLADDGRVKLADFGIAKATEQSSITQTGSVLGTAAYLAPEQGRGESAGPPADIYALGVVTYQLLAGRLPFEGSSLTELALKQQQGRPPRLDELVAGVTPELADAVAVALRLDPHSRYGTVLEMARAIKDGANGIRPATGAAATGTSGAQTRSTAATKLIDRDDAATRVVRDNRVDRVDRVVRDNRVDRVVRAPAPVALPPRQPRPGPPRRGQPAPVAAPVRPRRLLAMVVAVALLGGLIAGVVLATRGSSSSNRSARLTPVAKQDVPTVVENLKSLVEANIR